MTDLTVGVEEELQLVDDSGALRGVARKVIEKVAVDRDGAIEDVGGIEPELQVSQLEIVTPVCESLGEVRGELVRLRRLAAAAAAAESGCRLVSAGSNPGARWRDQQVTPKEPYERIHEVYAQLGREQVVFGCHVHVAVDERDLRIRTMNHVRPWVPTLLALSASSPHWQGDDTGYASYRYLTFSRWPTFLTPGVFDGWSDYQTHIDVLLESGSIDAPGRLYWTVRPSANFDTLEFRMCDACTTVDEAVLVTGLIRALVAVSLEKARAGEPPPDVRPELVRAAEWRAARWGLGAELIDLSTNRAEPARQVVGALLEHVRPGLEETGDLAEVDDLLERLLASGGSAARQRRAFGAASPPSPAAVIEHLMAETADGLVQPRQAMP